ncbi:calumenin-A [Sebastes umbrosus]|uniref:calumenin-A n=1 Tax=Sebastes umbrosus TaxID=72105 RepID=UPI00189D0E85|nr:calumenin-A [Sebastes umbrosus]
MIRPFLMCFVLCVVYGSSKPTEKGRVHEEVPLSNLDHDDEKDHEYDHEAFLGKEQAKIFDKLPPQESKRRLGIIVDKIDTNKDGYITEEEMRVWIRAAQLKQVYSGVETQYEDLDANKDGVINWEEYKKVTFAGHLDEPTDGEFNYTDMMVKDERRFKAADRNGDVKLNKEELGAFLYPEEFDSMHNVLAEETLEEIDTNGDGFIDMKEYIDDLYTPQEGEPEPDWLGSERQDFKEQKDKNKDGKMDKQEILAWILPTDEPLADNEAKHLMKESDANKDAKLTKQEILDKYEVFVGSQVTDYGNALLEHDEF